MAFCVAGIMLICLLTDEDENRNNRSDAPGGSAVSAVMLCHIAFSMLKRLPRICT